MRALTVLRNVRSAPTVALLMVFCGSLAPAQAAAAELQLHVQLSEPDAQPLSWMWRFQGELHQDGFVIGAAATFAPREGQPVVGTSAGSVDENGILTLGGPQPDDYVILYTGYLVVDLVTGAAAWVQVNGDVLLVGRARVTLVD